MTPERSFELDQVDAVVFDMDGVLTDTASIHARAWKRLFDDFLVSHAQAGGAADSWQPFDLDVDYRRHVDGKARLDGVRSFLASRGIRLPEGARDDEHEEPPSDASTVQGLGARKDAYFREMLERRGAQPYLRTVEFVRELKRRGTRVAVISASRNCEQVLTVAGILDLFDARVDGVDAAKLRFPGKPHPAVFIEAVRRLGTEPARSIVVEDALAGVTAGRRGDFALVVGVDRTGHPEELMAAGADLVVRDPADLLPAPPVRRLTELPPALERIEELVGWFGAREPVVCLDFDGTLSPIVNRPEDATIDEATRAAVRDIARHFPVVVLSGRDRLDVEQRVGLDELVYAGSHGFDVAGPGGLRWEYEAASDYLDELDALEAELADSVTGIAGAIVDRKRFAIALHDRLVADADLPVLDAIAAIAAGRHPRLQTHRGKRVLEFRPDVSWHKGEALLWIVDALGRARPRVTVAYLGDDTTDEDAFRTLRGADVGFGVIVGEEDRETAAQYRLRSPSEASTLLRELLAALLHRRADPQEPA